MKTKIMYCLFNQRKEPITHFMRNSRKDVETDWLKGWRLRCNEWGYWYKEGWRIKKVEVTIKEK